MSAAADRCFDTVWLGMKGMHDLATAWYTFDPDAQTHKAEPKLTSNNKGELIGAQGTGGVYRLLN